MSLDELEFSSVNGRPRRLFLFVMGSKRWAYAAGESDVLYLGDVYKPMNIELMPFVQSLSEGAPTVDIEIDKAAEVTQQFVAYMPVQPITVRVFKYEEGDEGLEYRLHFMGEVVASAFDEDTGKARLACRTVSSKIDRNVPWPVYQRPCNRALYSPGCGVNPEDYKISGVFSSVVKNELQSTAFAEKPDGWLLGGFVKAANGESRLIVYHVGPVVYLQAPFVTVTPGMAYDAFAGCDLRRSTCKIKFNNFPRWMGFAWIPGTNPYGNNVFGSNPTTAGSE